MFTTGIYINEYHLDSKTTTSENMNNKTTGAGNGAVNSDKLMTSTTTAVDNNNKQVTVANKTTKAPIYIGSSTVFVPKPQPVSKPPNSGAVDAGLGPQSEPVPSPPSTSLPFKLLWVSMVAPGNPSV
jgi:hypothetical protein